MSAPAARYLSRFNGSSKPCPHSPTHSLHASNALPSFSSALPLASPPAPCLLRFEASLSLSNAQPAPPPARYLSFFEALLSFLSAPPSHRLQRPASRGVYSMQKPRGAVSPREAPEIYLAFSGGINPYRQANLFPQAFYQKLGKRKNLRMSYLAQILSC